MAPHQLREAFPISRFRTGQKLFVFQVNHPALIVLDEVFSALGTPGDYTVFMSGNMLKK
jgi:hypothetical protein